MTAQVFVYSGQGVRSDGNFKLPKRIGRLSLDKKYVVRDFNVVLGFCGVDGVLLKPVRPFAGETLKDIESELGPMLDRLRESRLQQGFSLDQSAPVFHATDRYHPDRHGYARIYKDRFGDRGIIPAASTPKGVPTHAFNTDYSDGPTLIVGDPEHDLIALRKIVSPKLVDSHIFLFDHGDMLHRLSAERPSTEKAGARHMRTAKLHASAVVLLRSGVENTKAEFLKKAGVDTSARGLLCAFLGDAGVCESLVWRDVFGASPPRGVVVRMARQLGTAHVLPFCNYRDQKEFRQEAHRMRQWYRTSRKLDSSNCSTKRVGVAMSSLKIRLHYTRLTRKVRLEGLWRWRQVALWLREGGIGVTSGTVSVEAMWAHISSMMPVGARVISLKWFCVLADLAYLRTVYRHFHVGRLPPWTEADSLLAERLDTLSSFMPALASAEGQERSGIAETLFEPFL